MRSFERREPCRQPLLRRVALDLPRGQQLRVRTEIEAGMEPALEADRDAGAACEP